jgi:hypothetical protein
MKSSDCGNQTISAVKNVLKLNFAITNKMKEGRKKIIVI